MGNKQLPNVVIYLPWLCEPFKNTLQGKGLGFYCKL